MSLSERVILNALQVCASEGVEAGWLDPSVFENEPESCVFYPTAEAPWDDDDVAAVKMATGADLAAKIRYWQRVLDGADK